MKKLSQILSVSSGILLLLSGCSKKETPVVQPASTTVTPEVETTQKITTNHVVVENPAPQVAATEVVKPAEVNTPAIPTNPPAIPAEANPELTAQGIIQQAQALAAEKKYPEALAALAQLSNVNLTAEQQNLVARLKTEISNAMTSKFGSESAKSVGDFLKK